MRSGMSSSDPEIWFQRFREGVAAGPSRSLGRYDLGEKLGEGGAGVVYRAVDRELGRTVAVKILRDPLAGGRAMFERFRREAQVSALLSHPHLVTVHDVGERQGHP